jgi:hypothetical protein
MKYIKFIIVCVIFSSFIVISSYAQSGVAIPILLESPDARSGGMGNTGTAVASDINATYLNPGGLGFLKSSIIPKCRLISNPKDFNRGYFEALFSFSELPLYSNNNKSFWSGKFGIYLKPLIGTVVVDYCFAGLGEITRTAENGQVLGKYNSNENYLGIAYGISIDEDWGIGAKIKFILSNLSPTSIQTGNKAGTGAGNAFDLGVLWNPDLVTDSNSFWGNRCFSAGINLQNLGAEIDYIRESEPIPSALRFGVAFKPNLNYNHKLTLAIDGVKLLVKRDSLGFDTFPNKLISSWDGPLDISLGFGVEYWYLGNFAIRTGYYTEPVNLGNREYLTIGGSLRLFIIQADFSYNYPSGNTKYLTKVMKFTVKIGG